MTHELIRNLQQKHVAAWNEKDPASRLALLTEIYDARIRMHDKDFTLTGIGAISDFIGKLIADDPNYSFAAAKDMDFTQNGARLYGKIVVGPKPDTFRSMDFFILDGSKVIELYVFMDLEA
jgi:hypothetical protein